MKRQIGRKQFLALSVGGATLAAIGCSSDDDGGTGDGDGDGGGTGGGSTGDGDVTGGDGDNMTGDGDVGGDGDNMGGGTGDGDGTGGTDDGTGGADDGTGGTDDGTGGGGGNMVCDLQVTVSNNHGDGAAAHRLVLTAQDIADAVPGDYELDGGTSMGHTHTIALTAQDFTTLQGGGTVVAYAESARTPHCVTISCGAPSVTPPDNMNCSL